MSNEDGRIWITYNGELYNYRELRAELIGYGHRFMSNSDTETIVHAYEEWGDRCVERFRGMFAFGIMDLREGRLFLARDQLGIKPLYYAQTKNGFAFASELRPLCLVPEVCLDLDYTAIDQYLWLQYVPAPRTAISGIRKLPPAHRMSVRLDGSSQGPQEYWTLDFSPDTSMTAPDWEEDIDSLIRGSVQAHLVADVPFGAFLSGGVDSSLVVANMAKLLDRPVKTFSIGFTESEFDELPYARHVADRVGADHNIEIVKADALDMLPQLVAHYGDLFGDSSAIPTYYVSRLARAHVPMVLSGDGADEAFAGYWSYGNWLRSLEEHGEHAATLPHWLSFITYINSPTRMQLWRPEYRHLCPAPLEAFEREFARTSAYSPCHKVQYMDLKTYLPYDILTKVDVASMMNSLEVRTPFVDIRVVERAARIPEYLSVAKNGKGEWDRKLLLKRVAARYFSEEFVSRPKMGFAVPLAKWFAPGGLLRPVLEERLLGSSSKLSQFFEPLTMRSLINTVASGPLWLLLYCEEWLRQHQDWSFEQKKAFQREETVSHLSFSSPGEDSSGDQEPINPAPQDRPAGTHVRPHILLLADVPNWIFERHCLTLRRLLSDEFDFTIKYDNDHFEENDYDLIYPLEWYKVKPDQIRNPDKYVTGIRSHLVWPQYDFSRLCAYLSSAFNLVHVVSSRLYDIFAPSVGNLRYVTHGVDTAFFTPQPLSNPGSRTVRVGWAGNRKSVGKKGFAEIIEPLGTLPGVELVFCGYSDRLLTMEEMRTFYDAIDIYVCASDLEGSNNSLLEAASMARAIVTTDNGTVPEYLVNGANALIVERRFEAFAAAVAALRDDPDMRARFGQKARETVVARWDWRIRAEEFRAFFREALGKTAAGRGEPAPSVLIACTHFWPSIGGVETIAGNLGSRLVQIGYRVDVATWAYPGRSSDHHDGMRIISLDTRQVENGVPLWVLQLRQMVVSGDYSACILLADPRNQVIWSVEGAAVPPGTRLIIQPIINEEGYGEWRENREFRRRLAGILKQADAAISLTRNGPESLFMREEGVSPVYVPNAVAEVATVSDFRREYGIAGHELLILHVANLWPVKNQPALIRTVSTLSGAWRLVVIGHPSPDAAYVASVGDAIAAEPRATLIPGLPSEKVAAAMSAADVVVLASHGEVAPVTILEAMSHRTPWLATPECGSVHDLAGGIVAPLAAFPALLDALRSHGELRRELGAMGYEHWRECYRWDSVAPQWDRLIRSGTVSSPFHMPGAVARRMEELRSGLLGHTAATNRPVVSVIVPTYNRPSMLANAVKSILAQTFQDFEIIVVNDAGEDVEHVVAAFHSAKIRCIAHDVNKGLAAARNTGIRAANGTYIAYLDDDDVYYPHHLETLVGFLKDSGEKVAYSDACKGIQEQRGSDFVTVKREGFPAQDFDDDAILVDNFIPVLCVVHEKSCLDECGMFDETLPRHEDWDLWIRMSRIHRFAHVRAVTCEFTFRADGSGMTSGTMPRFLETYRTVYAKYEYLLRDRPDLRVRQRKNLFMATIRVYNFLKDRILACRDNHDPDDGIVGHLAPTGATEPQIRSVLAWQKGIAEQPPSIPLLEQAVACAPDNHLARIDLYGLCLGQNRLPEALAHVRRLLEFNPEEPDFEQAAARLTELISAPAGAPEARKGGGSPSASPLKVAVFSLDAPDQACPQLRLIEPLSALRGSVEILWGATFDGQRCTTNLDMIRAADVIVVQRFYLRKGNLPYLEQMFASGKPVLYEIDDLLTDVPDSNYLKPWIVETSELLPELLPRFHAVTVSTEQLRLRLECYARKIYVLPNRLNAAAWPEHSSVGEGGRIRIGYCGTPTHTADLAMIEPALHRIAREYGDAVSFTFMGCANETLAHLPGFRFVPFETTYHAYVQRLQELPLDIVLIPLADNPFNRCKSNIKWLEYSACGIVGIYADLPPYNTTVEHGVTGLLVGSDPQQWIDAIDLLVGNPELRRSIAAHARQKVVAEYALETGARRWLEVYREALGKSGSPAAAPRPIFSIIILTWNRARMLDRCLSALFASLAAREDCEIIVGDNGSNDDTAAVVGRYPVDVFLRFDRNAGIERYRELFSRARGDYLICLDDDVIELPHAFERGFESYFREFPEYGLLGLNVVQNELTNGAKPEAHHYREDRRGNHTVEEGYVIGCCMCIRSDTFQRLGGFDDVVLSFREAGDDAVLYRKATSAGMRAGIIRDLRCLHASGPHYSRQFGCLDRDMEKYRVNGLPEMVAAYGRVKERDRAIAQELPVVSIIIPVFNQLHFTQQCLDALFLTLPAAVPFEVIVVDNASTDGTGDYLRSLGGKVRLLANGENKGFAKACNQGARAARGTYLLFLNNDTVPGAGWLEPLVKVLENDEAVAAVGSKLLFPDGTIQHAGVIIADDRASQDPLVGKHVWHGKPADLAEANQPYRYQALTAACLLVRRAAFEAVQGFDEGYWNGYEDVDLCFKLGRQGWQLVYQPASVVIHHESKSGSERFSRVAGNIERLHRTWLGRVTPDMVIQPDGRVERAGSAIGPYGTDGARPAPKVSIIIPLYNQAQLTKSCVDAVRATAGDPERYELILVDNGSWDWTREYVKSLGDSVTAITNSDNLGFARACNQGAQAASGTYLLFLNNDTVPRAGWLDALLAGAEEDGADIVGAKLLYPNGRVQHAGVAFNKNSIGYHIFRNFPADAPAVNKKRPMQCVTAACLLVSRRLFIELGGFDEHFRNGFEDVDFCLRAGQAGRKILYTPHAVVTHHEEQSEGRKQFDAQNMRRYLARWEGKVRCDDEKLYSAEGFSVQWHADGSCTIRQKPGEAARAAGRYPLVPLVGSYAETPLARLSASPRMKAVLQAYSGARDVPTL